jgi:hypothetical protein
MAYPSQLPFWYSSRRPYHRGKLMPAIFNYDPKYNIKGWTQDGVPRRKVKGHYHLVWPKDKDRGKFGRFKDIIQNKGPDIYLSIGAQKHDYTWNRPVKERWSGWHLDRSGSLYDWPGQFVHKELEPFWVGKQSKYYNFHTRKYEDWHPGMWTDAIWQGPGKNSDYAVQVRNVDGMWYKEQSWDPRVPGQKMSQI